MGVSDDGHSTLVGNAQHDGRGSRRCVASRPTHNAAAQFASIDRSMWVSFAFSRAFFSLLAVLASHLVSLHFPSSCRCSSSHFFVLVHLHLSRLVFLIVSIRLVSFLFVSTRLISFRLVPSRLTLLRILSFFFFFYIFIHGRVMLNCKVCK